MGWLLSCSLSPPHYPNDNQVTVPSAGNKPCTASPVGTGAWSPVVSLLSLPSVCQCPEQICGGAESEGPQGVGQPAEEHHPDGRSPSASLRTVESTQ